MRKTTFSCKVIRVGGQTQPNQRWGKGSMNERAIYDTSLPALSVSCAINQAHLAGQLFPPFGAFQRQAARNPNLPGLCPFFRSLVPSLSDILTGNLGRSRGRAGWGRLGGMGTWGGADQDDEGDGADEGVEREAVHVDPAAAKWRQGLRGDRGGKEGGPLLVRRPEVAQADAQGRAHDDAGEACRA